MMGWAQVESRRMALGIVLSKIAMAVLFLLALPLVLPGLEALSSKMPRQVANAHTGFNVLKLLLVLPFVPLLMRMVENLVPAGPQANEDPGRPRYLENQLIDGNTLALSQSMRKSCASPRSSAACVTTCGGRSRATTRRSSSR
jgi:phosphate:Na+ symporter